MPFEENLSAWEFGPPADVCEDDQKLTFKVEVSGIDERDVKVEVENNVLTVRGERKLEKGHQGGELPPQGTPLPSLLPLIHPSHKCRPGQD